MLWCFFIFVYIKTAILFGKMKINARKKINNIFFFKNILFNKMQKVYMYKKNSKMRVVFCQMQKQN